MGQVGVGAAVGPGVVVLGGVWSCGEVGGGVGGGEGTGVGGTEWGVYSHMY